MRHACSPCTIAAGSAKDLDQPESTCQALSLALDSFCTIDPSCLEAACYLRSPVNLYADLTLLPCSSPPSVAIKLPALTVVVDRTQRLSLGGGISAVVNLEQKEDGITLQVGNGPWYVRVFGVCVYGWDEAVHNFLSACFFGSIIIVQ